MDKIITFCIVLLISLIPNFGEAWIVQNQVSKNQTFINHPSVEDLLKLDKNEIEKKIGRKLSLKEKIALKLIKVKIKKQAKRNNKISNELAKTDGFSIASLLTSVAGLLGLIFFSGSLAIGFGLVIGIAAVIFSVISLKRIKQKPESKKGKILAIFGLFLGSALVLISGLGAVGLIMG